MDFTSPVSNFMTRKLDTVVPGDSMTVVKEIFDTQRIHHIPVVKFRTLVGMISKSDFLHFMHGMESSHYKVEDVMTTGIASLESTDRINVALQVFAENLFHAIPILENGELVGILTTFDIIKVLVEEDNSRIKAS